MPEAVIVAAVRTPVGKAPNGALRHTRPDDLAAAAITAALARVPALDAAEVEDVILGCAMPEGEQGLNVARIASLRAGVPPARRRSPSTGSAPRAAVDRLRRRADQSGAADVVVAGGTESMSLVPMGGLRVSPNPTLVDTYPDVYLERARRREPRPRIRRSAARRRTPSPSKATAGDCRHRRRPLRRGDRRRRPVDTRRPSGGRRPRRGGWSRTRVRAATRRPRRWPS